MMIRFYVVLFMLSFLILPLISKSQSIESVVFDTKDSVGSYYLAITPESKEIKGVIVLLTSFLPPESLLPETKLHNVAYVNDILTVVAPMNQKLYADSFAVHRISTILLDIQKRFSADTSRFALAGYDEAGNIALRYTELTYEHPNQFPLQPKAVFAIDAPVDLFGMWHRAERQIKRNFWQGAVGDAHYYLGNMTKENGTIYDNAKRYKELTPFYKDADSIGHEQYLKSVAVRLYYDTDIEWQLKNRRNSLYDTKVPDGSELISRLLILGNNQAEFIAAKQPGMRSNGIRNPNALSIVDEVDCIQWLKRSLGIFDATTWIPPYSLSIPKQWNVERFSLPADFAPAMTYKGVEDLRFTPGWGDSTSQEYWSYAYLWWMEGTSPIDAVTLQDNLKALYSGLVNRNIVSRKIPESKQVPTTATI